MLSALLITGTGWADTATLTWSHDGANTTAYQVQRKPAGGAYATLGQVAAGTLTYVDQNVAPGDYCWKVAALNQTLVGPYSPESCATATGGPASPTAPYSITIVVTPGTPPGVRVTPSAPSAPKAKKK
jgi:hypothetical protein